MKSEIQKVLKAVNVSTTSELNETVMMQKLNKNPLAKFVETLTNLIEKNIELCKSAAGKIDQLKSEKIADQKLLIEIQQGQINSVQDTVKSEMKTWADIAKKNTNQRSGKQLTENSVKQAVRIVNEEERKSKNLMIYGYPFFFFCRDTHRLPSYRGSDPPLGERPSGAHLAAHWSLLLTTRWYILFRYSRSGSAPPKVY